MKATKTVLMNVLMLFVLLAMTAPAFAQDETVPESEDTVPEPEAERFQPPVLPPPAFSSIPGFSLPDTRPEAVRLKIAFTKLLRRILAQMGEESEIDLPENWQDAFEENELTLGIGEYEVTLTMDAGYGRVEPPTDRIWQPGGPEAFRDADGTIVFWVAISPANEELLERLREEWEAVAEEVRGA